MAQVDNVILAVPILQIFEHLFTIHLNPCVYFFQVHFKEDRRLQCDYGDWPYDHSIPI